MHRSQQSASPSSNSQVATVPSSLSSSLRQSTGSSAPPLPVVLEPVVLVVPVFVDVTLEVCVLVVLPPLPPVPPEPPELVVISSSSSPSPELTVQAVAANATQAPIPKSLNQEVDVMNS